VPNSCVLYDRYKHVISRRIGIITDGANEKIMDGMVFKRIVDPVVMYAVLAQ
jgi:hypothetical protein